MKILVTGGAGFIGSHTVVELYAAGYEAVILDNFSNSEPSVLKGIEQITGTAVRCYEGDFGDKQLLHTIVETESIQGVIHFAASKAVGESVEKPLLYYRNNVASTVALLEAMLEASVPNFVFSSSCTVYGQPDTLPVTEATPVQPATSPYGNTKQICEEILRDTVHAGNPLKAISLRYFNPIGAHASALIGELPRGVPSNLVPFVTQTAAGLRAKLVVFGDDYETLDGTCVRDFIHVVDLAKAHVKALEILASLTTTYHYDVFNIGTGRGNTVLEVINTFESVTGVKVNYQLGPRREGDIEQIYADVSKSKAQLHWQTEKSLAEALTDAWRWQQAISR
ncbi:MAG: UDP-glucose 4-epimerase GalE [Spirosomataceae bacterium]